MTNLDIKTLREIIKARAVNNIVKSFTKAYKEAVDWYGVGHHAVDIAFESFERERVETVKTIMNLEKMFGHKQIYTQDIDAIALRHLQYLLSRPNSNRQFCYTVDYSNTWKKTRINYTFYR